MPDKLPGCIDFHRPPIGKFAKSAVSGDAIRLGEIRGSISKMRTRGFSLRKSSIEAPPGKFLTPKGPARSIKTGLVVAIAPVAVDCQTDLASRVGAAPTSNSPCTSMAGRKQYCGRGGSVKARRLTLTCISKNVVRDVRSRVRALFVTQVHKKKGALGRWIWKLPECENQAPEKSLFRRHREDIEHEGLNIHIAVFRRELGAELDRLYRR